MKSLHAIVRSLAPSLCMLVTGCFYYDSTWGQGKAEQKHTAARLSPAAVAGKRGDGEVVRRTASVRACATPAYVAETLSWQDRFGELLQNANSVLEPSLGLTLHGAGETVWRPEHGEGSLVTVIDDLSSCEGPEVDFVVALVESTPKVVSDFHVLGRGQAYSPYLAMRASNDPAEIDALTRALPDLDEATRQKLYSDRKRHKTLTLFLHELAHTLGAIHRSAKDTIMSPSYGAAERGFDEPTLALLRLGLTIRLDHQTPYAEVHRYLERSKAGFIESERAEQVQLLSRYVASADSRGSAAAAGTTPPPQAPAPVTPVGFETLAKSDRQTFDDALKLESADPRAAWNLAQPLFEAHPAVRPVQELHCRLAKARGFYPAVVEAHCSRLSQLDASK